MDDSNVQDALARLRAEAAQSRESLAEGAAGVARFFNELVDHGLHRDEALQLTMLWLQQMLAGNSLASTIEGFINSIQEGEDPDGS